MYIKISSIGSSKDAVVLRRQKVKQLSAGRKAQIQASLAWQQFCRDADEVCNEYVVTNFKSHSYMYITGYSMDSREDDGGIR